MTPSVDDAIDWHEWGDEFVVRVVSRAETHLLSRAAGEVLLALLDDHPPSTLDALSARVFGDTPGAVSAEERASLQAIVRDFERLGIVTRPTP
jgi:hypothetical protein